jgi:hypothetical protein
VHRPKLKQLIEASLFEPLLKKTLVGNFNPNTTTVVQKSSFQDIGFIISFIKGEFDTIWEILVFDHMKGAHVLALKICWVRSPWRWPMLTRFRLYCGFYSLS